MAFSSCESLDQQRRKLPEVIAILLAQISPLVLGVGGECEERHTSVVMEVDHPRAAALASTPHRSFRTPPVPGIKSPDVGL